MAYPTFDTSYLQSQTVPKVTNTYDPYKPKTQQATYDPNRKTAYSGAEASAISRLSNIIKYGGYSPEQKQTMLSGTMAPVFQQAEAAREKAKVDAYSRGLGQSGVLSRGYTDIDKQTMASIAQAAGQIEQQGAGMVPGAIGQVQEQQRFLGQMKAQNEQFNAQLRQDKEELSARLGMHAGDLQVAIDKINATIDMDAANREVELTNIANQFNLSVAEMAQAKELAAAESKSSFWANIIGGGATVLGGLVGGPIGAAVAGATGKQIADAIV